MLKSCNSRRKPVTVLVLETGHDGLLMQRRMVVMRRSRFFKHMPTSQSIQENRYLKPLRRYVHHHYMWQFNRRGVAGGLAVGLFFGILSPVAQTLLGAIGSVVFRVNLPVAAVATLITNPFTVPPLYYAAYRLGKWMLGEKV